MINLTISFFNLLKSCLLAPFQCFSFQVKSFRSGRVQSVAVKRPINATLKELNCAVTSFSQLEDLILDESNITGSFHQTRSMTHLFISF